MKTPYPWTIVGSLAVYANMVMEKFTTVAYGRQWLGIGVFGNVPADPDRVRTTG